MRLTVGLPLVRLSSGYETRSCSRFHRSKSFMPPEMAVRMIQCRMHAPMAKMRIPPMKGIAVIRSLLAGLGRLAHLAGSRTIMGWPQRPYHLSRTGSGDFHHSLLLLAEACCGQSAAGTGAGARRGRRSLAPRDVRYSSSGPPGGSGECHGQTVERPQPAQPQADHRHSNWRSLPQDSSAHRHQAPSGKPDSWLEAAVDRSGSTRQLRWRRAAVILRFRAATARRRRRAGSSGKG